MPLCVKELNICALRFFPFTFTDKHIRFTSFEPFISFFALSGLSSGPSASKFRSLPNHGSIMAFELFSYSDSASKTNVAKSFPSQADLYVRFLFRNGTEDTLTAYPLFGRFCFLFMRTTIVMPRQATLFFNDTSCASSFLHGFVVLITNCAL